MNAYTLLDPTLKNILDGIKPSRQDWELRFKIIGELQDVVKSVESLRGATVEPFGSFVSNLFTRWGDLDISILLANGAHISSSGKKRKQNLLEDLLRVLRQKDGWQRIKFIPNARVPILKFESGHRRISCDVSIDNIQGLMKSKFLLWLNEIDKRFRDMVLLVKEWAKAHNINNPKAGSFNSYSLSLLVVFHFQTCVPPILPPLKDIYPRNAVDDLIGVRIDAERYIGETCAANISRYRSDKFREPNRSSLSELFILFLAKFSDLSLRAMEMGICPFTGKWEEIRGNMRWMPRTYTVFIEDPFEQPENTARGVSAGNLQRISETFQTSYQRLVSANQDQMSLLGTLVRPQILRLISGTQISISHTTVGHRLTGYQRTSESAYSTSQAYSQIHYTRQEDRHGHPRMLQKESHLGKSTNQMQGSFPSNSTQQKSGSHERESRKQIQSHPNNSTKQRAGQLYKSLGQQHMWRPKS